MSDGLPTPRVKRRLVDTVRLEKLTAAGFDPVIARVIASRPLPLSESPREDLSPPLSSLSDPQRMKDMDKATARLIGALENQEVIALETDHDCDGQTSHAILSIALTEFFGHPKDKVQSFIGHRLTEGYGLSEAVADRILASEPRPSLVITADNGSGDAPRIERLVREGVDVIVTDHHAIPLDGIPTAACAVLNPTREDCDYPDPYIAGCMVAWLLVAATRQQLRASGNLKGKAPIGSLLDYVAVGTVADCVSISRSHNNRCVIQHGLRLIAEAKRPCWRAVLPLCQGPLNAEHIGFTIGPLLNSDGRLDSALGSVSFLLSEDDRQAEAWLAHLQEHNIERKKIQKKITNLATQEAKKLLKEKKKSLCFFLEEGHPGVHGICASRVKDTFGRPTIIFSRKMGESELLTGSGRGIDGVHLKDALDEIASAHPALLKGYGGHAGAAGMSLLQENLPTFIEAFEKAISKQVGKQKLGPVIWSDGELPEQALTAKFVTELEKQLGPFGREFESPIFEAQATILGVMPIGDGTHARLQLQINKTHVEAIWFQIRPHSEASFPVRQGDRVQVVFAPKNNTFRGNTNFNPQIQTCSTISQTVDYTTSSY